MKRREVLKKTALISGYALSAPVIASILQGCQPSGPTLPDWEPEFLSPELGKVVMKAADLFLPTTDTPGALDVGVPEFIDQSVKLIMKPEDQQHFVAGLESLDKAAKDAHGKGFIDCSGDEQYALLNKIDAEAKAQEEARENLPPSASKEEKVLPHYFLTLKGLIIGGYFSSEEIATTVLNYDPIPQDYKGCIPFDEVGTTWAI